MDAGTSWLGPSKVNDVEASAREGLHAMTASEDGTLWCVWLDLRAARTQLFASKSTDQGAHWKTRFDCGPRSLNQPGPTAHAYLALVALGRSVKYRDGV